MALYDAIKVFKKGSEERAKLEAAAALLNVHQSRKGRYYVSETYFDYGQDWKWTTILCEKPDSVWGAFQALCPRDQEAILNAKDGAELAVAVDKVFARQ